MDSLTQICLGAAVGEVCLGKKIGNHAILWGAILGTLPDLDVIFKPLFNYTQGLVMHRGLSHSILFFIVTSPIIGYFIQKIYAHSTSVKEWINFSFWVMFTHAILDSFTSWGTMLLWPNPMRVAWNNIFVADLFYTIPLLVCLITLMFKAKDSRIRRKLNTIGLVLSSLYMVFTFFNKERANSVFEESLASEKINYTNYHSRPTPLNSILWDAVVESENEFRLGYYSLLSSDKKIEWTTYPKNHELMSFANGQKDWESLKHFSNNEFIVEKLNSDTLLVHDLRFGKIQIPGVEPEWVFTFIAVPDENGLVEFSQKDLPSTKFTFDQLKDAFSMLWSGILGEKLPGL